MPETKPPYPKEYMYEPSEAPAGQDWTDHSKVLKIIDDVMKGIIPEKLRLHFDRDPHRDVPTRQDILIAPSDGLLDIEEHGDEIAFVTYLRLTDVHVQRAPASGKVLSVERAGHGFYYPDHERYRDGVQAVTTIETKIGPIRVRQMTTLANRRIRTFFEAGDEVSGGDRLGRILLGSTVILHAPKAKVRPLAKPGERMWAGETILAEFIEG